MSYEELSQEQVEQALNEMEKLYSRERDRREELEGIVKKVKADFENYKKDESERKEIWRREAQRDLSEDLISVIDNFERALAAADEDSTIYHGVKMVGDELFETLEQKGLKRISAEGEEFDPRLHNAVDTEHHEDEDKVLEQKKPGYKHGEKVLRPADVIVSKKED